MKRAWLLIGLVACTQSRTELMIGVATDIKAPNVLDGAELIVSRAKDGFVEQQVSWTLTGVRDQPFNLPGSYGVYSDGEEVKLDVVLRGLKGDTEVVSRRAVLNLVDGQTLFFRMGLTAGCVGKEDCTATQSCVEGACRDANVNSLQLPEFREDLLTTLTCNSGVNYIDTATGAPMPMSPEAGMCPGDLCSEGTCLKPPPMETGDRTVTGSQFVTYVQPSSTVSVPDDLSTMKPEAIVRQPDGTFTTIKGQGAADGSFVIDHVPHGSYYLHVGTDYYVTSSSTFDLGSVTAGAPMPPLAAATTGITFNVTGLAPWATTNDLEAFAPAANMWWFGLGSKHPITAGATALTGYTITAADADVFPSTLIQNDDFALIQLTPQTAGTLSYVTPTKIFHPAPFTQTDGGTTMLSGAFTAVPPTGSATLDFRASQWTAASGWDGSRFTALNPQAQVFPGFNGIGVAITGHPGSAVYGNISSTIDYLNALVPLGPDVAPQAVTFGMPMTAGMWTSLYDIRLFGIVPYLLAGTGTRTTLNVGVNAAGLLAALPAQLVPTIGPVQAPTIGGLDLFAAQTGVGETPTLAWTAPAIGAPNEYIVTIIHLGISGNATTQDLVASVVTTDTSAVVPPGLLTAGQRYAFQITATRAPNPTTPNRRTLPDASSTIASAIITP